MEGGQHEDWLTVYGQRFSSRLLLGTTSPLRATTNGADGESERSNAASVRGSGNGCVWPFTMTDIPVPHRDRRQRW